MTDTENKKPNASDWSATSNAVRRNVRRPVASAYLDKKWGIRCAVPTLAKYAVIGGGPLMSYDGRFPVYAIGDLDDWAKSRLKGPYRSTSERKLGVHSSEIDVDNRGSDSGCDDPGAADDG